MDDLLREFLTETGESLAVLDVELVKLEQNPEPQILQNIFRLFHTIKGTCGFLGLPRLESVAHAAENVLGALRDGEIPVTPAAVSLVLESLDNIKSLLGHLEATETEPEGDDGDLINRLNGFLEGGGKAPAARFASAAPDQDEDAPVGEEIGQGASAGSDDEAAPFEAVLPEAAPREPSAPKAAAEPLKEASIAQQSIRINVDVIETLMTMVSELVLTRNQLLQMVRGKTDSEFNAPLQRLSHVTTELQEGVMKTRMQPIGNAWSKLPRIIRDLSLELGKKIDLQMRGAETELDRQVLEMIKDPLTHIVRNSADHGIEVREARRAAGKSEGGTILLEAFHEGGHIIIRIVDDGGGLPLAKIKSKVLANELATEAELEQMSDQQIYQYIFKAGFSTADKVTNVSGRGVGMDVVRSNIEKIGGTVDVKSAEGKGTTLTIKIPLTLAIISALIVESCGERFAIPQISVVELVRPSTNGEARLEQLNGALVLRLRNRLLPLVSLQEKLRLQPAAEADDTIVDAKEKFIIVSQVGSMTIGIIVDRVFDNEEIVVKPVSPLLRNISMISGNTILGDGNVIMILDLNGVAASINADGTFKESNAQSAAHEDEAPEGDRETFLLFRAGGQEPKAVPLTLVARLEDVDVEKIERANGMPVVQYRGSLMPLVPTVPGQEIRTSGRQPVIVFSEGDRNLGLLVDEIVDIVEDRLEVEMSGTGAGMLGSAIIAGAATAVIDVGYYLESAFPNWFAKTPQAEAARQKSLLLIDDSPFFRNMLAPLLSSAGYRVTPVAGAEDAFKLRESGKRFDIIVSDIDMPGMDGFSFAESVRGGGAWQDVPLVALSGRARPSDIERGREVGFVDYVPKFDRNRLLQSLAQTLESVGGAA